MEIDFPIEFIVFGTPVSQQAKRAVALDEWKQRVRAASDAVLPHPHFASEGRISVTLYYLPIEAMQGDIDNIIKPILDALSRHVYVDDRQVERLLVQRRDPEEESTGKFDGVLCDALSGERPALYVRVSDRPHEEFLS